MLITNNNSMMGTVYDDINKTALQLKIGDCLTFGSLIPVVDYCDVPIRLPILWSVIDKDDNKLKLLSYFFFEHSGYWSLKNDSSPTTWENTVIRDELNNKYYQDCFSENEKKAILTTEVKTVSFDSSCVITKDKLYVPALEDIENIPEQLKIGRGIFTEKTDNGIPSIDLMYCFYWLRDNGEDENENLVVQGYENSELVLDSLAHDADEVGVRAVMWVDAEKLGAI